MARLGILEATAGVLNQHGTADVPVEEILQAAGVSRATFYKHFRTKDQLLEGLYEQLALALLDAMRSATAAQDDPVARVRAAVRAYLDFHASETGLLRAMQPLALDSSSGLWAQRQRLHRELVEVFQAQLVQAGRPRVEPVLLRGLVTAIEGISVAALEAPDPPPLERAERAMIRIAVATLALPGDPVPLLPEPAD